jgi:UDP-glucose 4-epimerase
VTVVDDLSTGRADAVRGRDFVQGDIADVAFTKKLLRDGSCVRDYIHVSDLCVAHLLALDWLARGGRYECFNLGNGDGATGLEVIEAGRRVTGKNFAVKSVDRRPGDPPSRVADASKARRVLGWQPQRPDIEGIVRDAWNFEQRRAR